MPFNWFRKTAGPSLVIPSGEAARRRWPAGMALPSAAPRLTGRRENFFAQREGYRGSVHDRLTADWNPGTVSPNTLHRSGGRLLRERARDLVLNNPLAEAAVSAYTTNVLGDNGFRVRPQIADADRRRLVVQTWERWLAREADVTGEQSGHELAALWLEEVIVAGGCLQNRVILPRRVGRPARQRQRIPLAIELIAEERFAETREWLGALDNHQGNPIRRGIEYDKATGRQAAFWLWPDPTGDLTLGLEQPKRLSAEHASYRFFKRRIGQSRGLTLLLPAIQELWKLGYYQDNELMAAAIGACLAVAVTETGNEDDLGLAGDTGDESVDTRGNRIERFEPVMALKFRPGETVQTINTGHPNTGAEPWIRLISRSIGASLGLSYEELCRDASQANMSAARLGSAADRKRFRRMQRFTVNHFYQPTWEDFVIQASLAGMDGFPTPEELAADADLWLAVLWLLPGWETVNPIDDAKADVLLLQNKLATHADLIGKRGGDWEDTFEQLDREHEKADALGLVLDPQVNQNEPAPPASETDAPSDREGTR